MSASSNFEGLNTSICLAFTLDLGELRCLSSLMFTFRYLFLLRPHVLHDQNEIRQNPGKSRLFPVSRYMAIVIAHRDLAATDIDAAGVGIVSAS